MKIAIDSMANAFPKWCHVDKHTAIDQAQQVLHLATINKLMPQNPQIQSETIPNVIMSFVGGHSIWDDAKMSPHYGWFLQWVTQDIAP